MMMFVVDDRVVGDGVGRPASPFLALRSNSSLAAPMNSTSCPGESECARSEARPLLAVSRVLDELEVACRVFRVCFTRRAFTCSKSWRSSGVVIDDSLGVEVRRDASPEYSLRSAPAPLARSSGVLAVAVELGEDEIIGLFRREAAGLDKSRDDVALYLPPRWCGSRRGFASMRCRRRAARRAHRAPPPILILLPIVHLLMFILRRYLRDS